MPRFGTITSMTFNLWIRSRSMVLSMALIGSAGLACTKITLYPTTSLMGLRCSRTTLKLDGKTAYEFELRAPNKDGSLVWSAVSEEPIQMTVTQGKPWTLITWRVPEARVKTFKRFELSLFLASAGPNPIKVSVPTYQAAHWGFPAIPLPRL